MTSWDDIYAHVIACTGWSWEYIAEHVDIPRLDALNAYWRKFPPTHVLVAWYMGLKPATEAARSSIADPLEQDFIPANKLSESEFDDLLKSKGLKP